MARRRTAAITRVVVPSRQPAPVIRVSAPRAAPVKRRSSRRSVAVNTKSTKTLIGVAVGAAVLGFLEKQNIGIPTIPVVGKKGTVAILAYLVAKNTRSQIAWDVAVSATALAAHQLSKEGKIDGDYDDG